MLPTTRQRRRKCYLNVCLSVCLWISLASIVFRFDLLQFNNLTQGQRVNVTSQPTVGNTESPFLVPKCFQSPLQLIKDSGKLRWRRELVCDRGNPRLLDRKVSLDEGPYKMYWTEHFNCLKEFVNHHCYRFEGQTIPDLVHYVWFDQELFRGEHLVSVLSAVRFQRPCAILFHATEHLPHGHYWTLLLKIVPGLIHVVREEPRQIFGHRIGFVQHKSDIVRLEVLSELGGLYLDMDQFVLKNLTELQKQTVVMSHENADNLANSMILSQPGAKFINWWYQQYKSYNPKLWGFHSTVVPWNLAKERPDLITIVGHRFVYPDMQDIWKVVHQHYDITHNLGLHLYARHFQTTRFELPDVIFWTSSLGQAWRLILYNSSQTFHCD